MKKYLVVGNPVEHSLSPKLHNYWLKNNSIEAIYGKLQAYDNDLKELCSSIKNGQINGLNITVPFKKKIIPHLDVLSGHALRTQSVNTILKKDNKIFGFNTDVDGFELSLLNYIDKIRNKTVLILGAGGVAPSIIYVLKKIKASKILITNRTKIKSENLKTKFSDIDVVDWGETPAADVVINVTSLGLNPNDKIDIDYDQIGNDKFFYDVIYKPSKTLFLDEAKKRGNIIENGKMMFAYQAQKAFELWNNLKPEINEQVLNLLDD